MNGKISVIVPIYNGEQYIENLINCLIKQTYKDFEVFFVEDHSTDNSENIIRSYCALDDRLILLNPTEKMGTAVKGQEYALPYCSGKYHFFMSQDDFIDKDFFEKCINKMVEYDADVVIPNCVLFDGMMNKKLGKYPIADDYNSTINNRDAFLLSLDWKIHGFTMEKMDLFRNIGLVAEYYNSEEYMKRMLFFKSRNIRFANTNFYYRQDNPNSITKGRKFFHIDILVTDLLLYKYMKKEKFNAQVCKERLCKINKEYFKWVFRGIKYNLYLKNNCYFLKKIICLSIQLFGENLKLLR